MLRIVGIQRHEHPDHEFVLLQNQGHMRVQIRGHAIVSESALNEGDLASCADLLRDETYVAPGLFVLVMTGCGTPHWTKTRDGAHVYRMYLQRPQSLWNRCACPLHVMAPQHSYVARGEMLQLR